MKTRFFDPPKPRLFAHRGDSGRFPENTLPAFRAAIDAGLAYLELDVWATRDSHIIVHHDETVRRTCGVDRRVRDLTLSEAKYLDAGAKGVTIPTLDEVLTAFPDAFFNIEVKQKDPGIEECVLKVIRAARREDSVLLASEDDLVMARLRTVCDGIPTSFSHGEVEAFLSRARKGCCSPDYRPPGEALQVPVRHDGVVLVNSGFISAAHASGVEVHVWTVNDASEMARLLDMGVDGLMSDHPAVLLKSAKGRMRP
jgi:glycerophosphoryl diester phosphodiesterase